MQMVTRLRAIDGRIVWMKRRDHGLPLLRARLRHGWSQAQVAERTRQVDPAGKGVSSQLVARMESQGASAKDSCLFRSAELIAAALAIPLSQGFDVQDTHGVRTPRVSTQRGDDRGMTERVA